MAWEWCLSGVAGGGDVCLCVCMRVCLCGRAYIVCAYVCVVRVCMYVRLYERVYIVCVCGRGIPTSDSYY